ncbi:MAG: DMT family transporter [Muribaculaceae bacterium]|nr:DMT family transporter [Muribaculaceae bacterium]
MKTSTNPTHIPSAGSRARAMIEGNLLALSAAVCWGFNEPANKMIIPDWISAGGVAMSRLIGASVIIWIISLFIKQEKIQRGDWKLLWAAALMMLGFVYVFSLAFNTASPIDIAIILTFQPMLVVGIHALVGHEKVGGLELLGMAIAFGGALLVILGGGAVEKGRLIGDLYAMVCAVSYAIYLVIIQGPSKRYGTVSLMKWIFLFSAILELPLLFTLHSSTLPIVQHFEWTPLLVLLFIVVFPTVYCYLVTPPAIRMVGSELFSFYQYMVPVITTLVSLWLKLDSFHWYQPVSFVIIVIGVLLANYSKAKTSKAHAEKH